MPTNGKTTTIIILWGALQAIALFGLGILCTGVIANEHNNTVYHTQMIKDRTEMFSVLNYENNRAHSEILQRLARIEGKLP